MTKYVRPIIKQACPHCGKEETYYSEDVTEFGDVKCKACDKEFWSISILEFKKKITA